MSSEPQVNPKFRIAVCGGGIAGLCLGVALARFPDIEVNVYEAAATFKEVGAGVMMWGRTWRVLSLLGLADAYRELASDTNNGSTVRSFSYDYRRGDIGPDGHLIHRLELPYELHLYHRAHFLDILVDRLPKHMAHLGKRLQSYTQDGSDGPIQLTFMDGTRATCDALIGCDGIKSVVRRFMYERMAAEGKPELRDYIEPVWTGEITYRALVYADRLPLRDGKKHPALSKTVIYCGKNKHCIAYPIAGGRVANFGAVITEPELEGTVYTKPWVQESTEEELASDFEGWEGQVQDIIRSVEKPSKWAINQLRPLPAYVHGTVALVGDSAHAMPPHQGSGAGQAIEDAYMLSSILGHPSVTRANLSQALKAYEHVRLPFANHVLNASNNAGKLCQLRSVHGDNETTLAPAIQGQWGWVDSEDPAAQLDRALGWMTSQSS